MGGWPDSEESSETHCLLPVPQGTFLECHPDFRVTHRFHKACVSQLNGMVFCPHCGEDASEAQEVTIPRGDGGTPPAGTAAPAPLPLAQDAPGRADTSQPRYWPLSLALLPCFPFRLPCPWALEPFPTVPECEGTESPGAHPVTP